MEIDYYSYDYNKKEIQEDIELDPEQIELPQDYDLSQNSNVRNMVKDKNDTRQKTFDDKFYSSSQSTSQSVEDYENQIKNELKSKHPTKVVNSNTNSPPDNSDTKNNSNDNTNTAGSKNAYAGNTMVEWSLTGRKPHNNNDYHVRNPGYTCGAVQGTITVKIKVNQSGDVVSAKYEPNLSNSSNECMVRQAEKYAMKSRFNYSGTNKTQDGTITYTFLRQ